MRSILFLIATIYSHIFSCNFLRNEKYFLNFFGIFEIWIQFLIFSKKKMTVITDVLLNLGTQKHVVR